MEWERKNGRRRLGDGAEEQGIFLLRQVADSEAVGFVNKGSFNGVRRVKFDLEIIGRGCLVLWRDVLYPDDEEEIGLETIIGF